MYIVLPSSTSYLGSPLVFFLCTGSKQRENIIVYGHYTGNALLQLPLLLLLKLHGHKSFEGAAAVILCIRCAS